MERARYCCDSAVRGYHIYQDIWEANYGELLSCARETGNVFDPFAVCVAVYVCFRSDSWGGFPRYLATYCGLIFMDKEYTTKTTKISTPRKFLHIRYSVINVHDPLTVFKIIHNEIVPSRACVRP